MTTEVLIKIAPLIGGGILFLICLVAILRTPTFSNGYAALLVFGALLFVIPTLANFNVKALGVEFQGATTGLVTEQAAGIKAQMEDIKTAIADLGKRIAPAAPASAPPSVEYGTNRNSTVVVVYSVDPKTKTIAKQMEDQLLKKGLSGDVDIFRLFRAQRCKKGTARVGAVCLQRSDRRKLCQAAVEAPNAWPGRASG
jgi:hypothetical protein